MSVYDIVTAPARSDWKKHGLLMPQDEYIEYQLQRMSRREFLDVISDAIEERLEAIQSQIDGLREKMDYD